MSSVDVDGSFVAESDLYWLSFILDQLVSNAAKYASSRIVISLASRGQARMYRDVRRRARLRRGGQPQGLRPLGLGKRRARRRAAVLPRPAMASTLPREAAARLGTSLRFESGTGTTAVLELPLALDPLADMTKM